MALKILEDPNLVQIAYEMRQSGMFISDIAKKLSDNTGKQITQMALCRTFEKINDVEITEELTELDYPSRKEIENVFSELLQKENDLICTYGGEKLKRKLMIRIINAYLNNEFTYIEVRKNLNQWVGENGFYQHWDYLLKGNYIEKIDDNKFKFCDRVRKWKSFGQI
jgi:hypothetical protein